MLFRTTPEPLRKPIEVAEEWLDGIEQDATFGGEFEGAALEQVFPEVVIELEDLGADRGLLNAIGHMPGRGGDTTKAGNVMVNFEVVDVHRVVRCKH